MSDTDGSCDPTVIAGPEPGAAPLPPRQLDPTTHKRYANDLIHAGLHALPPTEPVAYFCECSAKGCFETVWLTSDAYRQRRSKPASVLLSPGHSAASPRLAGEH
jgi:hypothetical protein